MRLFSRLKKTSMVTLGGGTLGFFIAFFMSSDMPAIEKFVFRRKGVIAGSIIGLSIDALINPVIRSRERHLIEWMNSNRRLLQTGNLPPDQFLRGYVAVYYLNDDLGINFQSSDLQIGTRKKADEMIWLIDNIFPKIESLIEDKNRHNADYFIRVLSHLHRFMINSNHYPLPHKYIRFLNRSKINNLSEDICTSFTSLSHTLESGS